MHVVAAKAVAFKLAASGEFRRDQARTIENARVLAKTLADAGARLVSGGTDNHLALVDVTPLGVTGREAEALLDDVGITVNKNAIPFDQNPPMVASGIRLGTPAVTTRGMGETEMDQIAEYISRVLAAPEDGSVLARVKAEVETLCKKFPLYPERLA
jgi:glycine hydroxymethyltransferase